MSRKGKREHARRSHNAIHSKTAEPPQARNRQPPMALSLHHVDLDPLQHKPAPRRYAWTVFAIVFALMVVDYVDRQVVVSMFPHLKSHWSLSDAKLGALVSIVSITVALGTVPLSLLADRWSRVKSIFLMALVWSAATITCAYATSYEQLLGARAVVGLGEAAYGSAGAALLATLFPVRMRSTVLGAFLAAGLMGSVLGVVLGGVIAERWGWQAGFGAVGIPGLLLAVLFLLVVRDYKTVAMPAARAARAKSRMSASAVVAALLKPRSALVTCVGAGLQLIVVSTTYAWLPSYFNRYYSLAPDQAGVKTGLVVLIGGIGAIAWSIVADRLTPRFPTARLHVPAIAAVLTAVFMITAFAAFPPGLAQFALIIAGAATMTGSIGPVCAVVVDVVHPGLRATAASVLSLAQNLFGLAAGPLITGRLSDAYGLPFALSVVPLFCLCAAVAFVLAARTYVSDAANAEAEVAASPLQPLAPQAA
jgi:predicted MFS family arabinose efflux permease